MKKQPVVSTSTALGSCIAPCASDPVSKVVGMAHMVLPGNGDGDDRGISARHVGTGGPLLLQEVIRQGAIKAGSVAKIAGGAKAGLTERLKHWWYLWTYGATLR